MRSELERNRDESARRFKSAWPRVAPHVGCDRAPHDVETAGGPLATLLDADTGVDYIVVRTASGAKVTVAARTHVTDDRAHAGWTVRYRRPGGGECEYFRLSRSVREPCALYPWVWVEAYFASDGALRVYVARTKDVVAWCHRQTLSYSDAAMMHRQVRRNPEDGVLFFAPSFGNIADGERQPALMLEFRPSGSQLSLWGAGDDAPMCRAAQGAPEALWR